MSTNFESNIKSIECKFGTAIEQDASPKLMEQVIKESSEKRPEKDKATQDAENLLRSNPPDQAAIDALAAHLYEAYQESGGDNWSGQVKFAEKVNEAVKNAGSKLRVVINTATRAFKDEVGPGEVGLFSIVDTDGNVITSRCKY